MGRKLVRSANLTLTYSLLRAGQFLKPTCTRCRSALDLHQPDPTIPNQLLATCPECHSWYRLEVHPGKPEAVMLSLPEVAIPLAMSASGPAPIPTV